jgi:hypothetical protein
LPAISTRIVDVSDEVNGRGNRVEQPPQEICAWTAGAVLACTYRGERLA